MYDEDKDLPEESGDQDEDLTIPPSFLSGEINRMDDKEVEVKVVGVFEHAEPGAVQRFVLMRDNQGRSVPILIGPFEALSISMAIENEAPDRPLTHDLMKTMIEKLGSGIERILIDDLWSDVFYAKVYLTKKNNELIEIDSRPSDAIALALRFKAPIYMSDSVLEATRQDE